MKDVTKVFFSDRWEQLIERLLENVHSDGHPPFSPRSILVPDHKMKQWLMLELARRSEKRVVAGLKVALVDEVLRGAKVPNRMEMFALVYGELQRSEVGEIREYLGQSQKRLVELSEHLSRLFFLYGDAGLEGQEEGWQTSLLKKLFGPKESWALRDGASFTGPIHCFGCDFLTLPYWQQLFQASSLSVYLFSPCFHFWEDICTNWEKRRLLGEISPARRAEWESYLSQAPPLLANWGKLGRETLRILDHFEFEVEEDYGQREGESALQSIQRSILYFETPEKRSMDPEDRSIAVIQTGASPWREIEVLKENIERLVSQEGVDFSEIVVYAPNIEKYVPLIEFVFSDTIPYRILDIATTAHSPYLKGILRLLALMNGFETAQLLELFETPAFYKRCRWDLEKLQEIRGWLEEGLDQTLDQLIYFSTEKVAVEWSDASLLEEVVERISHLRQDLKNTPRSLAEWGEFLSELGVKYLKSEEEESFQKQLNGLRHARVDTPLCSLGIEHLLTSSSSEAVHASHLHAVRFSSIRPGAINPAQAVFLIGMDEDQFPRKQIPSSLDLLKKEKIFTPTQTDIDRYQMLQILFSAERFLYFSYGHLSPDEGKAVSPSLVLQELLQEISRSFEEIDLIQTAPLSPFLSTQPSCFDDFFSLEKPLPPLPKGTLTLHLSDLTKLARHPWEFYLQKTMGIYLEKKKFDQFPVQRNQFCRDALQESIEQTLKKRNNELPPGLIGEAQKLEILETVQEWETQLAEWGIEPRSIHLLESCREPSPHERPPLEIQVTEELTVRIIGEIQRVTEKGLIFLGDDLLSSLLRIWPEALVCSLALQQNEVFFLKSKKLKTISSPETSLRSFLIYYFRSLEQPSPLLPDWADFFLRGKKRTEPRFDDPALYWVLARTPIPDEALLLERWKWLQESFSELIALYPTRTSHATV
jgi:exodeoxyribonuclease V gamma subunit